MKHTLGISVYPDVSLLEDIKKYIELSSNTDSQRFSHLCFL